MGFFSACLELRKCIETNSNILSPVWYNESICINNKSVFYKQWFEKGICYTCILDFYKDNGELLCYEEFWNQHSFNQPFSLYYGILSIVKKLNLFYNLKYITINLPFHPTFLEIIRKRSKGSNDFHNSFINHIRRKPKYEMKWEKEFDLEVNSNWLKTKHSVIFKVTYDI